MDRCPPLAPGIGLGGWASAGCLLDRPAPPQAARASAVGRSVRAAAGPSSTGRPTAPPGRRRLASPAAAGRAAVGPTVRRHRLVGPARRFQGSADGRQAAADVDRRRRVGPRRRPPAPRARQHPRCAASASSVAADLARVSSATSKFACRQRPPRGQVRLPAQQRPELAVELGGRLQQPVAQLLELVLLEQEVLADAGVEGLDGLDGQIVAGLHRGLERRQLGVGRGQAVVGRRSAGQARRCRPWPAPAPPAPPPARPRRRPGPTAAAVTAAGCASPSAGRGGRSARARPRPARRPSTARRPRPAPCGEA